MLTLAEHIIFFISTDLYDWKIKSGTGDKNKWINILLSDYALAQYTGQCLQCCC